MKTRFWIILFTLAAVAALAVSLFILNHTQSEAIAGVYSDGTLIRTIDLSKVTETYEFTVSYGDEYNTIQVSSEGIRVIDSSCPDKICVHHGFLGSGMPIVCLPNRLVIRWLTETDTQYDAMTGI